MGDRRTLLTDRDVNANDIAALLVDDSINGHRGFTRLAVTDDELALSATDGNHAVDRLQAGLQWLFDGLARDDTRRFDLNAPALFGFDGAAAVDGLTQGIHDATDERLAHRHFGDATGALHRIALFDHVGFTEKGGADVILFEVQRDAENPVGKFQQLAGGNFVQTVNARNTVAGGKDGADLLDLDRFLVVPNLLFDDSANLRCPYFHGSLLSIRARCAVSSFPVVSAHCRHRSCLPIRLTGRR